MFGEEKELPVVTKSFVYDDYESYRGLSFVRMLKPRGEQSYKCTFSLRKNANGELMFVKTMLFSRFKPCDKETLINSFEILRNLSHPGIMKPYGIFSRIGCDNVHMVCEYMPYGDLRKFQEDYCEINETKFISVEKLIQIEMKLFEAVGYLHSIGICHGDIKSENIMIRGDKRCVYDPNDINFSIVLVDFEFASKQKPDATVYKFTGTPLFASPEMLVGCVYNPYKTDIWACGVVCYMLTYDRYFYDVGSVEELVKVFHTNTKIVFDQPREDGTSIPEEFISRMMSCLAFSPADRLCHHDSYTSHFGNVFPPSQL